MPTRAVMNDDVNLKNKRRKYVTPPKYLLTSTGMSQGLKIWGGRVVLGGDNVPPPLKGPGRDRVNCLPKTASPLNPNWHEAGVKVPSQHPISILTKLFFFIKIFISSSWRNG